VFEFVFWCVCVCVCDRECVSFFCVLLCIYLCVGGGMLSDLVPIAYVWGTGRVNEFCTVCSLRFTAYVSLYSCRLISTHTQRI